MTSPDPTYLRHVDELLTTLTAQLDTFDPDELEAETSEGVIKMTFEDGTRCILNRQAAAEQVWLAEGAQAWHFERDAETGRWMDTKDRGDLKAVLAEIIMRKLGRPCELAN